MSLEIRLDEIRDWDSTNMVFTSGMLYIESMPNFKNLADWRNAQQKDIVIAWLIYQFIS